MVLGHLFSLRHLNFNVFFLVLKRKLSLKKKKKKKIKATTKKQLHMLATPSRKQSKRQNTPNKNTYSLSESTRLRRNTSPRLYYVDDYDINLMMRNRY